MGALLDKAIVFATREHEGQYRKGTKIPYILHPLEAAAIVGTMTTDDELIAGAVLHDVVEDTETTVEDIRELFGERVAQLVASESENKREDQAAESCILRRLTAVSAEQNGRSALVNGRGNCS